MSPSLSLTLGAASGSCIVAVEHEGQILRFPSVPAGSHVRSVASDGVVVVDEVHEQDRFVERVAAIDVGKNELKVCVRLPGGRSGRRRQEVRTYSSRTRSILDLSDWLRCEQVELVVMEATGEYWKPPFYLLEDSVECWLLDARQVKHLPGRPKTDREDAIWLARVAERGMARPSFVPPKPIRQLRDLTCYRRALTQDRTRNKQRLEKLWKTPRSS